MHSEVWRSATVVGLILIIFSFVPGTLASQSISSEDGQYNGILVITNGEISVRIQSWPSGNLSIYLLDYNSGIRLVEQESFDDVVPIFAIENTDGYYGGIDLPADGAYILVVTISSPSTIEVTVEVYTATPHLRVLFSGILLVSVGLLLGRKLILGVSESSNKPLEN